MTDIAALSAIITDEPEISDVPYYFATKEGWYSNVPTLFGTAHVPADKWPRQLPDLKTLFHFSDEKVPAFLFDQALDFFRKVWTTHQTEATTYICRNAEGQYSLFVPKQYVTGASVNHKVEAGEMGDRTAVGTIHSHCNFSAFHSGTDEHDMGKMPGLHVTIGMVSNDEPEYAVAIAVGDTKFDIEPHDILDEDQNEDQNGFNTAPEVWMRYVHANQRAPWQGGINTSYSKGKPKGSPYKMGGMRPTGFQPPEWWGDTGYEYYSTFMPNQHNETDEAYETRHVELSKRWLDDEVLELAEMGYVLKWEVEHDPEEAKTLLEAVQATKSDDTLPMFGGKNLG